MSSPIRSMHLARSTTRSSDDSVLSVVMASSIALPKIVGRRLDMVAWAKENSW